MSEQIINEHIRIEGMTCVNCQNRIEKTLRSLPGIINVKVSYSGEFANVSYNPSLVSMQEIKFTIELLDYVVLPGEPLTEPKNAGNKTNLRRMASLTLIIIAMCLLFSRLKVFNSLPLAESGMGYGMLFLIGLFTSFHCIAMCGGINLSQCIPQHGNKVLFATVFYNLGRIISYSAVGFIVGAMGSVITLTGSLKGIVQIIAGSIMVIMGMNLLGLFPELRKLTPRIPSSIINKVDFQKVKSKSPLVVGLLNGLMPCGPLQAMQIYALSTGSPIKGAVSMFLFSLGTVPLMFLLGALSSILTKKFSQGMMTVGAVFVTTLGLIMFSQGAALSGFSLNNIIPSQKTVEGNVDEVKIVNGVQLVSSTLSSGNYPKITVQKGIPVQWTIEAPQGSINGCNKSIYIPEYGIEYTFQLGENIIEFTPKETGKFQYSCWMGMIHGSITVIEQDNEVNTTQELTEFEPIMYPEEFYLPFDDECCQ